MHFLTHIVGSPEPPDQRMTDSPHIFLHFGPLQGNQPIDSLDLLHDLILICRAKWDNSDPTF